jgi:hypothetical protein
MPTPMSRFANRQSPNQQAKIASMMEATMGNKRLSDRDLRNLQTNPRAIGGVGDPGWHDNPALRDEDMRGLGRVPPSPINPPNYPRAIGGPALRDEDLRNLQTNPPNPALRDEDMRGLITNPPLADEDIGRYEPPTPPETGIGRYDRDRVPDRARRKMVADASPSAGTQYGQDIAGQPAPEYVHRVANRTIPGGGTYSGLWGTQPYGSPVLPQDTYITLDPSEQYALQQNGYIDINGLRYAKNDYDEIVNIGPTPGRDTGGSGRDPRPLLDHPRE